MANPWDIYDPITIKELNDAFYGLNSKNNSVIFSRQHPSFKTLDRMRSITSHFVNLFYKEYKWDEFFGIMHNGRVKADIVKEQLVSSLLYSGLRECGYNPGSLMMGNEGGIFLFGTKTGFGSNPNETPRAHPDNTKNKKFTSSSTFAMDVYFTLKATMNPSGRYFAATWSLGATQCTPGESTMVQNPIDAAHFHNWCLLQCGYGTAYEVACSAFILHHFGKFFDSKLPPPAGGSFAIGKYGDKMSSRQAANLFLVSGLVASESDKYGYVPIYPTWEGLTDNHPTGYTLTPDVDGEREQFYIYENEVLRKPTSSVSTVYGPKGRIYSIPRWYVLISDSMREANGVYKYIKRKTNDFTDAALVLHMRESKIKPLVQYRVPPLPYPSVMCTVDDTLSFSQTMRGIYIELLSKQMSGEGSSRTMQLRDGNIDLSYYPRLVYLMYTSMMPLAVNDLNWDTDEIVYKVAPGSEDVGMNYNACMPVRVSYDAWKSGIKSKVVEPIIKNNGVEPNNGGYNNNKGRISKNSVDDPIIEDDPKPVSKPVPKEEPKPKKPREPIIIPKDEPKPKPKPKPTPSPEKKDKDPFHFIS